jgi:hypothetical protein
VFLALTVTAGAALGAPSAAEAARRKEAKQHLATGKKLLRDNFATDAVTELQRSLELDPTWEAEEELATAHRMLGQVLSARSVYDSVLTTYGSVLKGKDYERISQQRALVDRDVVRLSIDTEQAARITVDGKDAGTAPISSPIELDPGRHEVVVSKAGYAEDRRRVELPPGATTLKIPLKLTSGKVIVQTNPPSRGKVTVDGREVGEAPGTFELPPGRHSIVVNGSGAVSAVQEVEVHAGEAVTLVVPLKALPGTLSVQTPDPTYRVFVDEKMRGEGSRDFALPAGIHQLRIEKVGFAPYSREVNVTPGATATIAVPRLEALAAVVPVAAKPPSELPNESADATPKKDDYAGVYAGLAVFGTVGPTATHGLWDNCPVSDCPQLTSLGGGLGFRLGYSFGWVGIEALLIGMFDGSGSQPKFDTRTTKSDAAFYGVPRDETFTFWRYGFGGGLGLRLTPPTPGIRPTVGVAGAYLYRAARYASNATAHASEGIIPETKNHDSNVPTFAAPALVVDAGLLIGGTPGFKVHLGVLFIAEFDPRRTAEGYDGALGTEITPTGTQNVPHGAPEIDLVNGTQFFIGPVVGMQFGH